MQSIHIENCSKRISETNPEAGKEFVKLLTQANRLGYLANQLQRKAWDLYRNNTTTEEQENV